MVSHRGMARLNPIVAGMLPWHVHSITPAACRASSCITCCGRCSEVANHGKIAACVKAQRRQRWGYSEWPVAASSAAAAAAAATAVVDDAGVPRDLEAH
jgi:hypothetical protein